VRLSPLLGSLRYVLTEERGAVSFSPEHSDTLLNATFMEQLVGTLIKYGDSGRYEPYLAKEWSVSNKGLTYSFNLRDGIACEDGYPIDAQTYRKQLYVVLRLYLQTHDLPVLSNLKGYQDFKAHRSTELSGITAVGNQTLVFNFENTPDGIMEFLSMPYYGFYCPGNFAGEKWKDPHSIVSSGSYSLGLVSENHVELKKRVGWFACVKDSPAVVSVDMMDFSNAISQPPRSTIIAKRLEKNDSPPRGFVRVLGTPTDLVAVVLSPRSSHFGEIQNRAWFRNEIYSSLILDPIDSQVDRPTSTFYSNQETPVLPSNEERPSRFGKHVAKVVVSNAIPAGNREYVVSKIRSALTKAGVSVEIESEDRSKPGWKERLDEMRGIDIRVVRVDIGGRAENWVVKMMFCSRLGVSFPDPSGDICRLTERFDPSTDAKGKDAYSKELERIIARDAAVIPIYHTSFSWLYSNDIDTTTASSTMNLPRFDLIKVPQ
jgi:ABC-type transport system substrate-binding protein